MQEPGFGFPHLLRTIPLFGLIRFAKWDEIMNQQDPGTGQPFGQVIYHFARGLAMLQNSEAAGAFGELESLRTASKHPDLPQLKIFGQNDLATLASVAESLLAAEIAAKQNDIDGAATLARKAVEIEDSLRYSEPPDWPIPARHFLGAILIRAGKSKEAETVYREDLNRHRNNGWSLCGLMNSLKAQGRNQEAVEVERRFRQAWALADFAITSSRM
jgi:predicted Zn-dependent protease